MENARLTGPQEAETLAKPEQQLAGMRRETNTESHDSVLGVPLKFHATITDEQARRSNSNSLWCRRRRNWWEDPGKINNNIEQRYLLAESERQEADEADEADEMADDCRCGTVVSRCAQCMHVLVGPRLPLRSSNLTGTNVPKTSTIAAAFHGRGY